MAGQRLRLVSQGDSCVVLAWPADAPAAAPRTLPLTLTPPCHFLVWRATPPATAGAPSDGVSVGEAGALAAWRYKSAKNATVVAVIGDPISAEQRADPIVKKRLAAGLRCAPSLQGLLITPSAVAVSKKREHPGLLCVEAGIDERIFWMLAHD